MRAESAVVRDDAHRADQPVGRHRLGDQRVAHRQVGGADQARQRRDDEHVDAAAARRQRRAPSASRRARRSRRASRTARCDGRGGRPPCRAPARAMCRDTARPNRVSSNTEPVSTRMYQPRMRFSISMPQEVSRSAGYWKRKLRTWNGASIAKEETGGMLLREGLCELWLLTPYGVERTMQST